MTDTKKEQKLATRLIHGDHEYVDDHIGPAISVSSTYRYPEVGPGPWKSVGADWDTFKPQRHYYSRYTVSTSTRVEKILGELHGGHALLYSSGLSAGFGALLHVKPKRVVLQGGYFGFHNTIQLYRSINPSVEIVDFGVELKQGDLVWLETPLNPTGEVRDISYYAKKAHAVGAKVGVDATFAPPPLQNPFKWGADIVMHSATKYFGGHSDLLAGVLVVKTEEEWRHIWHARTYLGNPPGSLESWLLLRSLRTFGLRIATQSKNATELATWLNQIAKTPKGKTFDGAPGGVIERVWHGSLQDKTKFDPAKQHEGGYAPTFGVLTVDPYQAQRIPEKLKLFTHATSLGGVESLIEQRKHSSENEDPRLLRISVGIEDIEDLKTDFRQALNAVLKEKAKL
ncbi:hypothetical protein FRB91_005087 [Serendipita sp. 411]|nr:hypothetical protein FRC19_001192 [Serendipita sp. 401]KAG8860026.1 hypothetical protein FRB91_005087 [Serendipita sp. 411]KAG9055749.1 hypothetical protein FS842_001332 [Serendipita sp. 407]